MHGSILSVLSESNLKHEGNSYYIYWKRTKTHRDMEAPIPTDKLPIIKSFLSGRKKSIQWYNILLRNIGKNAGYDDVSTMTFRHTRTVRLIKEGTPLPAIAQIMGCSNEVIMRNYGKLTETQKREMMK